MTHADLDPDLLAPVAGRAVGGPVTVQAIRRLSGGASRESWSFDAINEQGDARGLVLRRDPAAAQTRPSKGGSSERSTEYELLLAADAGGVPVPAVRTMLAPEDRLGQGFVMDRVEGETIPRRILRDETYALARRRLAVQCGEIAAHIHQLPVGALPALPRAGAAEQIMQYRDLLDAFGEPHPTFELGLRELAARVPGDPAAPALVHGDFRNGNFIVGPDGIRAVLDWELAHIGDPIEDLGWLCVKSWRFGAPERVVGGFGDLDDLIEAYRTAGGAEVDPEAVRFWVALGTLKWGVICISQAFTHLNGVVRSVELATLGRRVAEMEWDLLDLLDGGW